MDAPRGWAVPGLPDGKTRMKLPDGPQTACGRRADPVRSRHASLKQSKAMEPAFASHAPADPCFQVKLCWPVPVWLVVNIRIADELAQAGHDGPARAITQATLDLVRSPGFAETCDPFGGGRFTGVAAMVRAFLAVSDRGWAVDGHPRIRRALSINKPQLGGLGFQTFARHPDPQIGPSPPVALRLPGPIGLGVAVGICPQGTARAV